MSLKAKAGVAWINGSFLPEAAAVISIHDRGFQLGDGVYETMRSVGGSLFSAARHASRLLAALAAVRIPAPWTPEQLIALWQEVLQHNGGGDLAVRTTVTRGIGGGGYSRIHGITPTVVIQARPLPETAGLRARGVTLGVVPILRPLPFGHEVVKTISTGAMALARELCGTDEALLLDHTGDVAEGAASALFAVLDDCIVAPPPERVLPSVSRAVLAERVPITVQRFTAEDLREAEAIVVSNISWGPVGVREFAGRTYPVDHPSVVRLQAAWDEALRTETGGERAPVASPGSSLSRS